MEDFPVFSVDENGNIVQSGVVDAETEEITFFPGAAVPSVSSGDAVPVLGTSDNPLVVQPVDSPDYTEGIAAMQDDVAFLAAQQASSAGYLSSSALDTFDRVVRGYDYEYYCAYRYDSDQYNSIMYLSDDISWDGNTVTMEDAMKVQLWRYRYSSNYNYEYYYSATPAGDVDITLGSNLMYYTNTGKGYPVLGDTPAPSHYPSWLPGVGSYLLMGILLLFAGRRIYNG